jgi:uncharacterized membrane protein
MSKYLVAYFSTLLSFLVLDGLWLGLLMIGTYRQEIGQLMLASPKIVPAALFYLCYAVGVIVFAILPGIEAQQWQRSAMLGVLLGLMAYGTYDMTNLATLKDWTLKISLIDLAWGAFATGVASTVGFFATSAWIHRQA